MDWFDKDDNMFIDKDIIHNYNESDIDIESIFLKKQNSFVDYESKIDDFIFDKLNDQPEKTNIFEVDMVIKEKQKENSKIFAINKLRKESTAVSINSLKSKIQRKEDLNTVANTSVILQNSNTKSIKETAVGSLSPRSKEDTNEIKEFKLLQKDYTTSVDENSESYKHDISLNSKVSIKYLTDYENEKYDSMSLYNNTDNKSVIMNNSAGMKQLFYNLNAKSTQSSSNSLINIKSLGQLTHSERMKFKKEKAKILLDKKRDRTLHDQSENKHNDELADENTHSLCYSKGTTNTIKDIKMLRNRISAQRSRDRKKKEMDELKNISQNLLNENCFLKKELENRDREIRELKEMKDKLKNLCRDCNEMFTSSSSNVNQNSLFNSSNRFASSLKFSMMAGFLVIVCIIGTLTLNGMDNNQSNSNTKLRNLNEESINKADKDSNGIILYNHLEKKERKLPFEIKKDIDKFISKKLKNPEFNEINFLGKKRLDFFNKMEKRKKPQNSSGFLQKSNDIEQCINVDKLTLNIINEQEEHNGIIIKDDSSNYKNGIVPVNNSRLTYEQSRDSIKSMYCKDFITTAEENSQMFKKLFEKLNKKIENKYEEETQK
jgi:hypothetical protein